MQMEDTASIDMAFLIDLFSSEEHPEEQHTRSDPENPSPSPCDEYYDDLIIFRKDYLLLSCWILTIPSLLF